MDLLFLFWSISIGIISGAQLYLLALIVSLVATILLFILNALPVVKAPYLLVLNFDDTALEEEILSIVKAHSRSYAIKSKNITKQGVNLIAELRTNEETSLMSALQDIDISNISLVSHDGETRY